MPYKAGEVLPSPADYGAMVARVTRGWDVRLMFEPGRVISGNAGVLLTRVVRVKRGGNGDPFVIVDAAMNDLARPALYGAWHHLDEPSGERMTANVVGPICETGDTFAMGRDIDALEAGELAVFRTAETTARPWRAPTIRAASYPKSWWTRNALGDCREPDRASRDPRRRDRAGLAGIGRSD